MDEFLNEIFNHEIFNLIVTEPTKCALFVYGEPLFCFLVSFPPMLILIILLDIKFGDKIFGNEIDGYRVADWICLICICIPPLFGIFSAIIDMYRYCFTHEIRMFTILGTNTLFG